MSGDTTPDAARVRLEIYRRMSGEQRVENGSTQSGYARARVTDVIPKRAPRSP